MKIMKYDLTQIDPTDWYSLSEIERRGWITNIFGRPDRRFIWREVQKGNLKARNFSVPQKPYWKIKGANVIEYIKKNYL